MKKAIARAQPKVTQKDPKRMKVCRKRLQKEFVKLQKDPAPNIEAYPNEKNIKEWHYVIFGPKDSVYAGGVYHGRLVFPTEYPYKPPAIYMITPNGRFKTKTRLCLSISDFHPESWNPLWSVGSILTGLLSFMLSEDMTTGSMRSSKAYKKQLAQKTMEANLTHPMFCQLFPHLVEKYKNEHPGDGKTPKVSVPSDINSINHATKLSIALVTGVALVGFLAILLGYIL